MENIKKRQSNPFPQDKIYFDEDTHTYFEKATGQHLVSPTQIIKEYSHPFDPTGEILKKCAARKGISPAELDAQWKKLGADARDKGHSIHFSFEHYIKKQEILEDDNKDIILEFKEKVPVEGDLHPEVVLYDFNYGIAGRTDLIEIWWDNIANIYDFKTNKKINTYSYGKKMFYPLDHVWDASFYHYELQLSLYALMLEHQGYCPRSLNLLWINPKRKIQIMPVKYRRGDVIKMLKDFGKRRNEQ